MSFTNLYHNPSPNAKSSSCTKLLFTDQQNVRTDSGAHSSLHSNCHHQSTHCKLNVNIEYPPPSYEHLVWNYNKANVEGTKKSKECVNWEVIFNNKSIHKQISVFKETLMNIFSFFIPNKLVTFGEEAPSK